jgi:hypothetical protein
MGSARRDRLRHHGEVYDLFGIHIVNTLLTVVTIGIYRFWAKTRIRRFLWSQTSFLGDRFEYTGTGKELLLGFAIVMVFLIISLGVYTALFTWIWPEWFDDQGLQTLYTAPIFILSVVIVGMARFRARRYRLSRTLWRGIRGAQTGSSVQYGLRELLRALHEHPACRLQVQQHLVRRPPDRVQRHRRSPARRIRHMLAVDSADPGIVLDLVPRGGPALLRFLRALRRPGL